MRIESVWSYETDGPIGSYPVVADTPDGPLLLVGTGDGRLICLDGAGRAVWSLAFDGELRAPVVASINGNPAVLVGSDTGWVYACTFGGERLWSTRVNDVWRPEPFNRGITSPTGIAPISGGGEAVIVVADKAGVLSGLSAVGETVWRAELVTPTHFRGIGSPAVADLDGDGVDEIVVSGFDGRMHCLGADGSYRWMRGVLPAEGGYLSPVIINDGAGPRVVVMGERESTLCCLDADGSVVWDYTGRGAIGVQAGLAPVVIDGRSCILVSWSKSGQELITTDGESVWYREYHGGSQFWGATVGDIDGDGDSELLLIRAEARSFWILDSAGDVRLQMELDGTMQGSPVIADLDGDGVLEFLIVNAESGCLTAYRADGAVPGGVIQWPTSRGHLDGCGTATLRDGDPIVAPTKLRKDKGETVGLTLSLDTPLEMIRHPIQYEFDGDVPDDVVVRTEVTSPDGVRTIHARRPDDPVHAWFVPVVDGEYSIEAAILDANGDELGKLTRRITFACFNAEIERGKDLSVSLDRLAGEVGLSGANGYERSVKRLRSIWSGLVSRCGTVEIEGQRALGEELSDCLARMHRALVCGARMLEVRSRTNEQVDILTWPLEHPWMPYVPTFDLPPDEQQDAVHVKTEGRSHEATAIAIANVSGNSLDVRVRLGGWEGDGSPGKVTLRRVTFVPTARDNLSPDAIPEIGEAGIVTIPEGETARIWIDWSANEAAGTWMNSLHVLPLVPHAHECVVPVSWEVLPVLLPERMPMWFHVWAYSSGVVADMESVWKDLIDHHVNVFDLPVPSATYGVDGDISDVDWSGVDEVIDRVPDGSFFLWHGGDGLVQPAQDARDTGSDIWRAAYEEHALRWIEHLKAKGIGYDRHANYVIDEPGIEGGRRVDYTERFARIWKGIDPQVLIYANPAGGATVEQVERLTEVVDLFSPMWTEFRGMSDIYDPSDETVPVEMEPVDYMHSILAKVAETPPHDLWTYRCVDGVRDFCRMRYYWEPVWKGAKFGLTGMGFWSYAGRSAEFWGGPNLTMCDWELVYPGDTSVVPSVRWQGVRLGLEDAARLHMLGAAAETLRDRGDVARAMKLDGSRDEMIDRATESRMDEIVVAEVRAELRTLLLSIDHS
jgi:hypothetical protein